MALKDLIEINENCYQEIDVTPERLESNLGLYRHIIAY